MAQRLVEILPGALKVFAPNEGDDLMKVAAVVVATVVDEELSRMDADTVSLAKRVADGFKVFGAQLTSIRMSVDGVVKATRELLAMYERDETLATEASECE